MQESLSDEGQENETVQTVEHEVFVPKTSEPSNVLHDLENNFISVGACTFVAHGASTREKVSREWWE